MRNILCVIAAFISVSAVAAEYPAGNQILESIDQNMSSNNRVLTSRMIIHGRRTSRTVASKSWLQGKEKAFTEYTAPARERGTKMLKLSDRLWMFSPSTDRTIQISGHMLRQSVMGSDLSYEDMMEDPNLTRHYHAEVTGIETLDDRPCWVLKLTAKKKTAAYHARKLWVDQERNIPLKEELFAKSGRLLKKLELKQVEKLEGRWFPKKMIFKDVLKKGKGTEFIVETIQFDADIPDHIFTKAALR